MEASDEALVAEIRDGRHEAFDTLVRRHAAGMYGFLNKMLPHHHEVDDVFQDVCQRVYTKLNSFDATRKFKPWLYAVARNAALDACRRYKRQPDTLSFDEHGPELKHAGATPASELDANETRELVRQAVDQLPPRQRTTLVLAYFHGFSYPEVAETMECSVGTVKTQMSRALATLARRLPDSLSVTK